VTAEAGRPLSVDGVRVSRRWLALRESADAAARSRELAQQLPRPATSGWMIHDLGGGTGAMGRWLAPRLAGRQHWVLHDRDPDLLEVAADRVPNEAADGAVVTVEARLSDITRLDPGGLAGASLITASALLDMLTKAELAALVAACAGVRVPILLTLSVIGHVTLIPADPLDSRVGAAFNDHQRRSTERGRLLGPDAVTFAVAELARRGFEVLVRPSSWRLGASEAELATVWFEGWVAAAREQGVETELYANSRLAQARAGELGVTVDHADLLALPQCSAD
jgi:hypothetical protein